MNRLNQLVYARLMPAHLSTQPSDLSGLLGELREAKLRISGQLLEIDRQPDAPHTAQTVRRYQLQLVAIADVLHLFQLQSGPAQQAFYQESAGLIMELIMALEQYFPEHLAKDLFLPGPYAQHILSMQASRMRETELLLQDRGIDPALVELIFQPMRRADALLTFGTAHYFRRLMRDLREQDHHYYMDPEERILFSLFAHNFNCPELLRHATAALRAKTTALRTLQEKKGLLSWYEKELRHLPSNEYALHPGKGSIRDQLLQWIKEEKHFMHNMYTTWNS